MDIKQSILMIREANSRNKLIAFLGAGVSKNSGYSTWNDLVRDMDIQLNYSGESNGRDSYTSDELLKIPQFLSTKNKAEYTQLLRKHFDWLPTTTNPIVDTVLQIRPHHIITTNFDKLIEFSLALKGKDIVEKYSMKKYCPVYHDKDILNADGDNFLIKMHGDISQVEQMVLRERDYLDYSSEHPVLENFIKTLLIDHTFLFVGYGLGDYNLKLIMNWVDVAIRQSKAIGIDARKHFYINASSEPMSP
ncbi:SIR2 family protein [Christensenellaceae bacterium OttesenSCG-928-M15]|nr:SIR2 family protein [Christensenellaceae bacterium OttesenSCG-928-M15]